MSEALLSRLVADGAITREDADRVAARLARTGGAVDSVLLELHLVPASRLPEILARVSGLPTAPDTAFTAPDPRARRVFPAKVAERHAVAPFALDGRELSVVTTYPPDTSLLEELGFLLSLHLRAHVAPEWRVRALVQQLYGTPLPERLVALGAAPAPAPSAEAPDFAETPVAREEPEPAAIRAPDWTPDQARQAMAEADGPDEAIRVALRAARDRFSYAAAFSVRRDTIVGLDALGLDPRAREACRRVAVDLAEPGLFGPPLETRAPYLGPPPTDPVTSSVLSGLGRVGPRTVLVAPVSIGDRVACVIYADNDDEPVSSGHIGELFPLLGALADSLARMIRERKGGGGHREKEAGQRRPEAEPEPQQEPPPGPEPQQEPDPRQEPEPVPRPRPQARPTPAPVSPLDAPQGRPPPGEEWSVVEPARAEPQPLRFAVDVDLGEYEVISAGEALASGRAEDLPSLVEALAASHRDSDDRRELVSRLVAGGPEAAVALVARLPGPVESGGTLGESVPVEEWGPIFAGVVAAGRVAERPLLDTLEDADPERRRAAVALLSRLGTPGSIPGVAALVQDDDESVATEAARALAAARGTPALGPIVAEVRRALASGRPVKAARAARALALLGDADSVPVLIQLLDGGGELAAAASEALSAITLQRLGPDSMRWIAWWREWRAAPRSSWLFQALGSPDPGLRRRAAAELRRAGEPPDPYDPDGPEPERQRSARTWAAWWREEGLAL